MYSNVGQSNMLVLSVKTFNIAHKPAEYFCHHRSVPKTHMLSHESYSQHDEHIHALNGLSNWIIVHSCRMTIPTVVTLRAGLDCITEQNAPKLSTFPTQFLEMHSVILSDKEIAKQEHGKSTPHFLLHTTNFLCSLLLVSEFWEETLWH